MTSLSIFQVHARNARTHRLAELPTRLRRRLMVHRQQTEFDRALVDAGPTMRNELLAIHEDLLLTNAR